MKSDIEFCDIKKNLFKFAYNEKIIFYAKQIP